MENAKKPVQLHEYRQMVCNACDRHFKPTNQCKECLCFLKLKTRIQSQKCPLGKWEA